MVDHSDRGMDVADARNTSTEFEFGKNRCAESDSRATSFAMRPANLFMQPSVQPRHVNFEMKSQKVVGVQSDAACPSPHFDMRYALERLKTFDAWPRHLPTKKEQLASGGFIYTQKGDMVKCHCCQLLLKDWRPDDVPLQEHFKWNRNCEFLKTCYVNPSTFSNIV